MTTIDQTLRGGAPAVPFRRPNEAPDAVAGHPERANREDFIARCAGQGLAVWFGQHRFSSSAKPGPDRVDSSSWSRQSDGRTAEGRGVESGSVVRIHR
jgi:hypothetical protein